MFVARNDANGFASGGKLAGGNAPSRAPLPHISDLTSVPAGVDPNLPIRKLLEAGDGCMRQADTWITFNRPDLALQEYIRGCIIAIQIIPHHKEYVSIRSDRSGLGRLYEALQHKVISASPTFEKIKEDIKADNERTGVQPTQKGLSRPAASRDATSSHSTAINTPITGRPRSNGDGPIGESSQRQKPAVHPKPQALHGNAIRPGLGHHRTDSSDLNARFANLRGPSSQAQQQQQQQQQQDPRIKTYPLVPPPPPAPRGSRARASKITAEVSVPNLPKVPDAIYSPARGTVVTEDAQLSSSTVRGHFGIAGSSNSISSPRSGSGTASVLHQPATNGTRSARASTESTPPMPIPTTDTLTPQQLCDLMRSRSGDILLIDVRPRDEFESGHILSQHTICIEPSVLLRDSISAAEISESNVLAPAEEQLAFERRNKFELVVFYDNDSDTTPYHPSSDAGKALVSLRRALVDFNYGRELRNPPKLLSGGLEAWTDLMGPNSLQASSSGTRRPTARMSVLTMSAQAVDPAWLKGRHFGARRLSTYNVKPLKPEEVKKWQETLKREDMDVAHSPNFVRSTEDFLRRFPPVMVEQESMTSGSPYPLDSPQSSIDYQLSKYDDLPAPPTRPAPAIPRPSYSGLSSHDDRGTPTAMVAQTLAPPEGSDAHGTHVTGLYNKGTWCYSNSVLQVLRFTAGFGEELAGWRQGNGEQWIPAPDKDGVVSPQLLMNIMGNLFQWMSQGCFRVMKAQTLMDYLHHLTEQEPIQFGDNNIQQDTSEYMQFVFAEMDKETNRRWNGEQSSKADSRKNLPLQERVIRSWNYHSRNSDTIVDKYFRGMEVVRVLCKCSEALVSVSPFLLLPLSIVPDAKTLSDLLRNYFASEAVEDYKCDKCSATGTATRTSWIGRLPEVIIIQLSRFRMVNQTMRKVSQRIEFPIEPISFEPFYIPANERSFETKSSDPSEDSTWGKRFKYRVYGIVVHSGPGLDSGHYWSYVRRVDPAKGAVWYQLNDSTVRRIGTDSEFTKKELRKASKDGDTVPYVLFLERLKEE